jgi:NAD(P)-dependent dehydrogenase (short-subunit alcohol dehydrogenase family)
MPTARSTTDVTDARVAVVTGASGGVGRATAREFARRGFDVAVLARGNAGLVAAEREVVQEGRRALALEVDVADADVVDAAAARVEAALGPIDVWVNNAMATIFSPFADMDPADFLRAVDVTFLGQVWGTRAALRRMRPRDRGTVVNIGSALAFIGIPLQSPYCAAKFACRGFFNAVRTELLHDGSKVRVCMVDLPAVNTPQFEWGKNLMARRPQPVPPIYQPEFAARSIVRVALTGRRAKILGSWNRVLVLATTLSPAFANHYAALGAWESQLTNDPAPDDSPSNLHAPVDRERDFGAHGRFGDRAGGFRDLTFLRTLPTAASQGARALVQTLTEKVGRT